MARISSWNVRGLNWPNKDEDVKIFLREKDIGLVGLLETKVKEKNVDRIADNMFRGWRWQHNFHLNSKGRIWVAWRPQHYTVQILSIAKQYIHYRATQVTTMKKFFITFVYEANHE